MGEGASSPHAPPPLARPAAASGLAGAADDAAALARASIEWDSGAVSALVLVPREREGARPEGAAGASGAAVAGRAPGSSLTPVGDSGGMSPVMSVMSVNNSLLTGSLGAAGGVRASASVASLGVGSGAGRWSGGSQEYYMPRAAGGAALDAGPQAARSRLRAGLLSDQDRLLQRRSSKFAPSGLLILQYPLSSSDQRPAGSPCSSSDLAGEGDGEGACATACTSADKTARPPRSLPAPPLSYRHSLLDWVRAE